MADCQINPASVIERRGLPTEMTPSQERFIRSLLVEREVDPDRVDATLRMIEPPLTIDKMRASRWIQALLERPMRTTQTELVRSPQRAFRVEFFVKDDPLVHYPALIGGSNPIPAGAYAVPNTSADAVNEHSFYRVWMAPHKARNEGAWVIKQVIGGQPDVKLQRYIATPILLRIADAPAMYAELYGKLIGKCGVCGRTLTNDESRARGIGPVCAERWGW